MANMATNGGIGDGDLEPGRARFAQNTNGTWYVQRCAAGTGNTRSLYVTPEHILDLLAQGPEVRKKIMADRKAPQRRASDAGGGRS